MRRFSFSGIDLEYEEYGSGALPLLAFHGFGNSGELFRVLEPSLGKKYRILAFNLPGHGESRLDAITAKRGISKEQLKNYFTHFLEGIKAEHFSLIGFSIGGKIALVLTELFQDRIKDLILI